MPPTGGLNAIAAADFLAEQIAEPVWLADGIVPEHAIGFIGGAPKVFKSLIALDMAVAIAAGAPFLGRFVCQPSRRALIMQFESSRAHFQRRVRAVTARFGGPPSGLFVVSNTPVVFEDPVSMTRVDVTLADVRPDLFVLDPLAAMTTGDENSAQEMGRIVRQLRDWRDRYGCAIAVVHHTNKAAERRSSSRWRSGTKLRGSSAFYAGAEWALWVERPDESAPRVEVRSEQKEAAPRRPFGVTFDEVNSGLTVTSDEVTVQVKDDDIIELIVARGYRATAAEISQDTGLAERTVRDRMTALAKQHRAYYEKGTGRGRKPLVYLVPRGYHAGPRLVSQRDA